jgi:nucleoside-diphosphate-sugar epimerase
MRTAIVTGAGGFIGHHFVSFLKKKGYHVYGIDIKYPEYAPSEADLFALCDLRQPDALLPVLRSRRWDEVYHFAADMGGIGYISKDRAGIAANNLQMNSALLKSMLQVKPWPRVFFSSSACVYRQDRQDDVNLPPLVEEDAWPANPEPGYGLEKLVMEELCHYYQMDYGLETRVARFHNIYGPLGTYDGGREKAPAAICRKVAAGGELEVWGDGQQTRSFLYIDDCLDGVYRLMQSNVQEPLNIGSAEVVTINQLVGLVAGISHKTFSIRHNLTAPQGVRGRNCDGTKAWRLLGWSPQVALADGLAATYAWIEKQVRK